MSPSEKGKVYDAYKAFVDEAPPHFASSDKVVLELDKLREALRPLCPPNESITWIDRDLTSLEAFRHYDVLVPVGPRDEFFACIAKALYDHGRIEECREALYQARGHAHQHTSPRVRREIRRLDDLIRIASKGKSVPDDGDRRSQSGEKSGRRRRGRPRLPPLTLQDARGWIQGKQIPERSGVLVGPFYERQHYGFLFVRKGSESEEQVAPVKKRAFRVLREFFVIAAGSNAAGVPREELITLTCGKKGGPSATNTESSAVSEANTLLSRLGIGEISAPDRRGFRRLTCPVLLWYWDRDKRGAFP